MSVVDYSSIYSVKDFYNTFILPLYFDADKLQLSTVGDLGMFLDITSSTTEDMINMTGRYINETMPGKAELPDFIYANAANYGVSDILAHPAKMSMLLLVKEKDVLEHMKLVDGHLEFMLDAAMTILVDDLRYSLPYDIKIVTRQYQNQYNHMSFYDMSYVNGVADEKVPYIKTMKTDINGDIWLVLRVNVYQYKKTTYEEVINTNSILNIPYIDLPFNNQLCNFELFYQEAGSSKKTQLMKKMDGNTATTSPFFYYRLTGDQSIRFSFANDDRYFVPDYNSVISVELYETNGKAGVFGFFREGINISIRATTNDESISYNRNIFPMGLSQGNSINGRDQLTLDKIKMLTSEAQITVKSYTTDTDLNMYFTNFASVYNHDAIFIKQRDDYAGREYGCFTRIGDGVNIFPTNTMNIRLSVSDIDKHFASLRQYIVKPGTVFQYQNDETKDDVVRKKPDAEKDAIEYASMALMVITTKPNKVNYYMTTINKNVELDYTYFNLNSPFNFVSKRCSIKRDAIHGSDTYTIELAIARVDGVFNDIQLDNFQLQQTNGKIEESRFGVIMVLDTNVGNYVEMKYRDRENLDGDWIYIFQATIGTTDMIDEERILLTDLRKRRDDSTDERLIDMINPKLKFVVTYNFEDIQGGDHVYNDISCVKNNTLCNEYEPREEEFYFAYPLNLIRSHVMFEDAPEDPSGFRFLVKQVPLFGADFLLDGDKMDTILTDLTSEHTFLSSVVDLLHGAFTINMKFYCTYGRSRNFYISCGRKDQIINRVDCTIDIGVKFYSGIIQEDYIDQVRIYIKEFFEKVNRLSTGTNQAFISKLNEKLHTVFPDQIEYAIFHSINDYPSEYQVIRMTIDMNNSPAPDFIPEYLTIRPEDVIITTL